MSARERSVDTASAMDEMVAVMVAGSEASTFFTMAAMTMRWLAAR